MTKRMPERMGVDSPILVKNSQFSTLSEECMDLPPFDAKDWSILGMFFIRFI
jgi:hypothetical protein